MTSECFRSGGASLIVFREDLIEHELKIVRQRRLECHLTSVGWMLKDEPAGVQERPLERQQRAKIASDAPAEAAVHRVADDRMADLAQVDANLMRASRCYGDMDEGHSLHVQRRCDARDRRSRAPRFGGHLLAVTGVAADW